MLSGLVYSTNVFDFSNADYSPEVAVFYADRSLRSINEYFRLSSDPECAGSLANTPWLETLKKVCSQKNENIINENKKKHKEFLKKAKATIFEKLKSYKSVEEINTSCVQDLESQFDRSRKITRLFDRVRQKKPSYEQFKNDFLKISLNQNDGELFEPFDLFCEGSSQFRPRNHIESIVGDNFHPMRFRDQAGFLNFQTFCNSNLPKKEKIALLLDQALKKTYKETISGADTRITSDSALNMSLKVSKYSTIPATESLNKDIKTNLNLDCQKDNFDYYNNDPPKSEIKCVCISKEIQKIFKNDVIGPFLAPLQKQMEENYFNLINSSKLSKKTKERLMDIYRTSKYHLKIGFPDFNKDENDLSAFRLDDHIEISSQMLLAAQSEPEKHLAYATINHELGHQFYTSMQNHLVKAGLSKADIKTLENLRNCIDINIAKSEFTTLESEYREHARFFDAKKKREEQLADFFGKKYLVDLKKKEQLADFYMASSIFCQKRNGFEDMSMYCLQKKI